MGVPLEVTRHHNTKEGGRRNNWDGNGVNMIVKSRERTLARENHHFGLACV